jgi:nitrite reductase/ring-hydroxylating ferredoxin subunit/DMSO/TMAO reductase YedYZ heme-binding membrane subunit
VSLGYQAVGWNANKRAYDRTVLGGLLVFLLLFAALSWRSNPHATLETHFLRACGCAALVLLHVILSIGPLARLDRRFLPLLYNRRHLGVTMALCALAHGGLALFQFHFLGDVDPLLSLLSSERSGPRFQALGFGALLIVLLMAATSHDFWLANLGASAWKALHMLVYPAYALVLAHVGFGALQGEAGWGVAVALAAGALGLVGLHLVAGWRERGRDRERRAQESGWVDVCAASDIPDGRARVVTLAGERVAVFRHQDQISALSNVCRHQGGPLGEGRVIDGCVTCPWHGYQYRPSDGCSPPPFTEKVATFAVRIVDERVQVEARPGAPGTPRVPAPFSRAACPAPPEPPSSAAFFVGYLPRAPASLATWLRPRVGVISILAGAACLALAAGHRRLSRTSFEYGQLRTFEGLLLEAPAPALVVARPRAGAGPGATSRYLLVARGKHGARDLVAGLDGRRVRAEGSLIWRDGVTMIELARTPQASVDDLDPAAGPLPEVRALGATRLVGEIVDSKCFLGVMNPGELASHRACATRCISGGIPPALCVRDGQGRATYVLLVGPRGEALNEHVLDRVAVPVEARGELARLDDLWVLFAEPSEVRRVE